MPDLALIAAALAQAFPQLQPIQYPPFVQHGDLWFENLLAQSDQIIGLLNPAGLDGWRRDWLT